jgi:hypothetical protein
MRTDQMAHGRPPLKRIRPDLIGPVEIPLDCNPRSVSKIFFVRNTYSQYEKDSKKSANIDPKIIWEFTPNFELVHEDGSPFSVCAQYIKWLYPKQPLSRAQSRARRRFIRLYRQGDVLFFTKAEGSVPPWADPSDVHDKVVSFLQPKERVLYESLVSRGVSVLAADRSHTLCKEIKFVIHPFEPAPTEFEADGIFDEEWAAFRQREDEWQQTITQMDHLLEHLTQTGPVPRCPQGIKQLILEFGPSAKSRLLNMFSGGSSFFHTIIGATKNIRLQGRLTYRDLSLILPVNAYQFDGIFFVDELHVSFKTWKRHVAMQMTTVPWFARRIIFFIGGNDSFFRPQEAHISADEYNEFVRVLRLKTNQLYQELWNGTNFEFLREVNNPKQFVTDASTWDTAQEQGIDAQAVFAGAKHIRDKEEWWVQSPTDMDATWDPKQEQGIDAKAVFGGAEHIRDKEERRVQEPMDMDAVD